jgi:hypothetical protein
MTGRHVFPQILGQGAMLDLHAVHPLAVMHSWYPVAASQIPGSHDVVVARCA